jgi:hypothetical protein
MDQKLVEVCSFKAAAEPRLLTEAGASFALSRGSNPEDLVNLVADRTWTQLPAETTAIVPNTDTQGVKPKDRVLVRQLLERAPIDFQVFYQKKGDNQPRPVEIDEEGTLPEPAQGTKVTFRLKHKNTDKYTYGVVLKVNGENTISPEEREPDDFRAPKWILEPKDDYVITGFLKRNLKGKAATFTVLPASESKLEEVNYGPHAGTFTLVVFLGRPGGKAAPENKDAVLVRATSRGVPDKLNKPNRLEALQGKLREEAAQTHSSTNGKRRGLIVPGETAQVEVDTVAFSAYPTPVSVIQFRYYKPRNQE